MPRETKPIGRELAQLVERQLRNWEIARAQKSGAPPGKVDMLGISHQQGFHRMPQRVHRLRNHHQMQMIGHETIRLNREAVLLGVLDEQLQKPKAILHREENILTAVPTLSNMMRASRNH